ncbi:hypothetical protein [Legionella parisiensis]|uniref:Ran GTPase-activating protein (RanGAP) involved in mRNA processing and transport n=1 Tax=Legionella parisiensis TaxID=45071 RepID=A0A1E5JR35_9GAMM|nr:hypothetical protein [Legionella parisiensis]KTD40668.1 hypothetical protein Lpar_1985 [Legionella parisiensis]OEH46991.1 hypothetical protein lpari_02039 [Legionella parisiensis]STX76883.1 Ran GTPase-activating protein (RanGAP) involved in mRNA processing and transport [Legionella parisiensis]
MRKEIMEKITGNKNGLQVNLAGMKITDDEILEVLETIKRLKPTASMIDLDNNNLSDLGATILSKHLSDFKNIEELSLQFNKVGREGAIELFSLKKVFPNLDILFHGNKIVNVDEMDEIEHLALGDSLRP